MKLQPPAWSSAVIVLASGLFALLAIHVVYAHGLTQFDAPLVDWFQSRAHAEMTAALLLITRLHNTDAMVLLIVASALILISRREWRAVATLGLIVPGGMLWNTTFKHLIARARPSLDEPLLVLHTYSFPSGHATAAVLFYGFWLLYSWDRVNSPGYRAALLAGALTVSLLVGTARVYLGVHFLTDVLGAYCFAIAWLTLCWFFIRPNLPRRAVGVPTP